LFSSYAWNYTIVDNIAKSIKETYPNKILVLGGPHIGINEPKFLATRKYYDFICQPTKPGETFIEDLINSYIENNENPNVDDISWELRSQKKRSFKLDYKVSVYEEHFDYLKETLDYARKNKVEPFVVLETTRGCPYQCVFCEWGGGINTKIIKKDITIVKRDILALKRAGFRDAYLTDANFGAFFERDLEIFKFAWDNKFNLTDISTVKTKNLEKRKELIDAVFRIVGKDKRARKIFCYKDDMWEDTEYISIVPTVSLQSVSNEAMRVAKRTDLSAKDKIELSSYISQRCTEFGFPVPALELILGMPGSTLDDFYDEMEVIWNFKAWTSFRHDYMFLPDSHLNSKEYKDKYQIKTVEVYSDIVDEDGVDNWNSLYKDKKTYFKTMQSCYSYTQEEMYEMWFMNNAGNYLLKTMYEGVKHLITPHYFGRACYQVIKKLDDFKPIYAEIVNMFDNTTPPVSIRKLGNRFRTDVIEEMLESNLVTIKNEVLKEIL